MNKRTILMKLEYFQEKLDAKQTEFFQVSDELAEITKDMTEIRNELQKFTKLIREHGIE